MRGNGICQSGRNSAADLLVAEQSAYGLMYGESRRELLDQRRMEDGFPQPGKNSSRMRVRIHQALYAGKRKRSHSPGRYHFWDKKHRETGMRWRSRVGMQMNKRCTNSSCRRTFSTLHLNGRYPYCGKMYPQLCVKTARDEQQQFSDKVTLKTYVRQQFINEVALEKYVRRAGFAIYGANITCASAVGLSSFLLDSCLYQRSRFSSGNRWKGKSYQNRKRWISLEP